MPSKNGRLNSQLFIQFKKFDLTKAEDEKMKILNEPKAKNDPEWRDRFSWELSYQPEFTSMPGFVVNGPKNL